MPLSTEQLDRVKQTARYRLRNPPSACPPLSFYGIPSSIVSGYIVGWAMPYPTTTDQVPNIRVIDGNPVHVRVFARDMIGRDFTESEVEDIKEKGIIALVELDESHDTYYFQLRHLGEGQSLLPI